MMTGLPRRPIITFGTGPEVIALRYPQKLWTYESQWQGGSRVFSSGDVEAFTIREDNRAGVILRVHDCEYLEVRDWILDAMQGNQFEFQFDADDPYSAFTCLLDKPMLKDEYAPPRAPDWPHIWEVPVLIRTLGTAPIYVSSSGSCGTTGTLPGS